MGENSEQLSVIAAVKETTNRHRQAPYHTSRPSRDRVRMAPGLRRAGVSRERVHLGWREAF